MRIMHTYSPMHIIYENSKLFFIQPSMNDFSSSSKFSGCVCILMWVLKNFSNVCSLCSDGGRDNNDVSGMKHVSCDCSIGYTFMQTKLIRYLLCIKTTKCHVDDEAKKAQKQFWICLFLNRKKNRLHLLHFFCL